MISFLNCEECQAHTLKNRAMELDTQQPQPTNMKTTISTIIMELHTHLATTICKIKHLHQKAMLMKLSARRKTILMRAVDRIKANQPILQVLIQATSPVTMLRAQVGKIMFPLMNMNLERNTGNTAIITLIMGTR